MEKDERRLDKLYEEAEKKHLFDKAKSIHQKLRKRLE